MCLNNYVRGFHSWQYCERKHIKPWKLKYFQDVQAPKRLALHFNIRHHPSENPDKESIHLSACYTLAFSFINCPMNADLIMPMATSVHKYGKALNLTE